MSDVADFTGISAGSVTEVATGSVECTFSGTPGRYVGNVAVPAFPATTRSVLVLAQVTTLSPGPTGTFTGVSVFGGVTGVSWPGGAPALTTGGTNLVAPGTALAPQYFPYYGLVDSSGSVQFTFGQDTIVEYWVLAMPDADILGSPQDPLTVALSTLFNAPGGSANPLYVATPTGSPLDVSVTAKNVTDSASVTHTGSTVTNVTLVPAPVAGFQRVIEYAYSNSNGSVFFGLDGANPATSPVFLPNGVFITPGWRMSSTLQLTIQSGTSGNLYVTYHDEPNT